MAITNTFKNAGVKPTTNDTYCYTCPSTATAIVQSLYLTNTGTADITVNVKLYKPGTSISYAIGYKLPIPVGSFIYLDKPMNLSSGDVLQVSASVANSCEGVASVMEMT